MFRAHQPRGAPTPLVNEQGRGARLRVEVAIVRAPTRMASEITPGRAYAWQSVLARRGGRDPDAGKARQPIAGLERLF